METTRHFVATVYAVNNGAVALHHHDKLDMWLPAGGHVELDELPHEAATREAREELGLDVDLVAPVDDLTSSTAQSIPKPQHFLLEDINVSDGEVGHQHIDFIYYGRVESREIDPADGESPAEAWEWVTPWELDGNERFPADVREAGKRAVDAVEGGG
jgi:8-oxo-dGTP pyrophosphatase MutT (NUDIX family)